LKVQTVPIASVVPYARNPRKNAGAVAKVAASLREFGWRQPIVVDSEMVVVVGHTRLMAAQQLGMTEVPVHVAEGLTANQVKAYRIADNRVHEEAEWDDELLALELGDLRDAGLDLALTGFDEDELAPLLEDVAPLGGMPPLPDGDKVPFQQMTFTLHDEQAEQVAHALEVAKKMGAFVDSPNENGNGNALSRVCEIFLGQHGNG
jgi:ParB-like chromosome segregation protein Spo0J